MSSPVPGDLVAFTGPPDFDPLIRPGALGVIQGVVGQAKQEYLVCWGAYSTFRGKPSGEGSAGAPVVVESSGGPARYVPSAQLRPAGATADWTFWRWRDLPRRGGGVKYTLAVPVWGWPNP